MTRNLLPLVVGLLAAAWLSSCGEQGLRSSDDTSSVELDSNKTTLIGVSGKMFSIPSPVQTALLIRNADVAYNGAALHDPSKADTYQTRAAQAMNLGVYGTTMAYASLYDDGQLALRNYKAVDKLANNLGIIGAIDANLVKRLAANVSNADSLLVLSGQFYRAADEYLKENERFDIASYVLLGGWAEASYLTSLAASEGVEASIQRLAEQKESVKTLLDVLNSTAEDSFKKSEAFQTLAKINTAYSQVSRTYTYAAPEVIPEQKTTRIHSQSTYTMSAEVQKEITELLNVLRNAILQ